MPEEKHDTVWREVEVNTTLPPEAKKIVLRTLNDLWRDWKSRVKAMCFIPYQKDPNHQIPKVIKEQVDLDQLSELMLYWEEENVQEIAKKNMANRAKKKHLHRTGKLAFPLLKEKMRQEGKSTTKLDVLIESRSCGKGINADQETAKLIQGINEELAKKPESERTEEFKDDIFINALGQDPQGRGRCTGRGVTRSKLRDSLASNAPTTYIAEKIEEFRELKNELALEVIKIVQMKMELNNQKKELDEEKERMINEMRAEFKDEVNNMKLNLDYFVSLVDPATLQAALSSGPSLGGQVANLPNITREQPKNANKVTPPNFQQHNPTPNFLTSHERAANGNKRHKHTFDCNPCEVGSNVLLFCSELPKESVAEGVVLSMDPNEEIDDVVLGPGFVKVVIKRAIKPNYYLLRPRKGVNTVGQAVGKIVAWQIANVSEE